MKEYKMTTAEMARECEVDALTNMEYPATGNELTALASAIHYDNQVSMPIKCALNKRIWNNISKRASNWAIDKVK